MSKHVESLSQYHIYIGVMKIADQISEFLLFFFQFAYIFFKYSFIYMFWKSLHKSSFNHLSEDIISSYAETIGIALFSTMKK